MYDRTELSVDSRRAEIEYRTAKLTAVRRATGSTRRWRHRSARANLVGATN